MMNRVARWRVHISDSLLGRYLICSQTNPGEDSNAVMLEPEKAEFVLAADYERLQKLLREIQTDPGNWLSSDLQRRISMEIGPGGSSPSGWNAG